VAKSTTFLPADRVVVVDFCGADEIPCGGAGARPLRGRRLVVVLGRVAQLGPRLGGGVAASGAGLLADGRTHQHLRAGDVPEVEVVDAAQPPHGGKVRFHGVDGSGLVVGGEDGGESGLQEPPHVAAAAREQVGAGRSAHADTLVGGAAVTRPGNESCRGWRWGVRMGAWFSTLRAMDQGPTLDDISDSITISFAWGCVRQGGGRGSPAPTLKPVPLRCPVRAAGSRSTPAAPLWTREVVSRRPAPQASWRSGWRPRRRADAGLPRRPSHVWPPGPGGAVERLAAGKESVVHGRDCGVALAAPYDHPLVPV
jgi:hypothetical protein